MFIRDGKCYTIQGEDPKPDVIIEADSGDLVAASLARANPMIGLMIRKLEFLISKKRREDFVASITGNYAF